MHWHRGSTPYRTDRIYLLGRLGLTFITFDTGWFVNHCDLAQVSRRTRLNQGCGGGEAETVDATTSGDVVKDIEDEIKGGDVLDVEAGIVAYVSVMGYVFGNPGMSPAVSVGSSVCSSA